jgi:predicted Zn-dependent peptidase
MRDPTTFEVAAYYPDPSATDKLIGIIDEEISKVAEDVGGDELERVTSAMTAGYLWECDQLIYRTVNLAVMEQVHGGAELVNDLPSVLRQVTPADVVEAARTWLRPNARGVLEWKAGART